MGRALPPHHLHKIQKKAFFLGKPPLTDKIISLLRQWQIAITKIMEISSTLLQVQCRGLCRGTSPTARKQTCPLLCCSSFHQGETCQTNDLTFPGIHRCWGYRTPTEPQNDLLCADPSPWSTIMDYPRLPAKKVAKCSCLSCRWKDEGHRRLELVLLQI